MRDPFDPGVVLAVPRRTRGETVKHGVLRIVITVRILIVSIMTISLRPTCNSQCHQWTEPAIPPAEFPAHLIDVKCTRDRQ